MKRLCLVLAGVLCGLALGGSAMAQNETPAAQNEPRRVRAAATVTTLKVSAGTLAQPITFDVSVRAPAAAGSPTGSVSIADMNGVFQTLALMPTNSTNRKFAYSVASFTLTPQPGGSAYFFGGHFVGAEFIPGSSNYLKSTTVKVVTVKRPAEYQTLADGVKTATIAPGSGPAIQSGQSASVLYTGYLATDGFIFDDSANHGGEPFTFTLGAHQVIPGFDEGTNGMRVGETRIIVIPPAEGYGNTAQQTIPAHSTLIFVVTLEAIS
jgi:FlaG/FlaF family flagellin (archaellin)